MSKTIESNINEMINTAGDGSGLQLPPAFVMVNPRQHRKYKKNNERVDGRSKGAKDLFSRIQRRKMKEETDKQILEYTSTETERAQKSIGQQKKLSRQKDLQKNLFYHQRIFHQYHFLSVPIHFQLNRIQKFLPDLHQLQYPHHEKEHR